MKMQTTDESVGWVSPPPTFALIAVVLGVLIVSSWTIVPAIAANGSVTYTYDALGRVSTASYDTGVIVIYAYDSNGNRTQQTINVNTGTLCWNTLTGCTGGGAIVWDGSLWQ